MWSGSIEPLDDSVEGTDRDRDPFSITSTATSEPAGVVSTTSSQSSPIDEWLASTRWTRADIELAADVILAVGVLVPIAVLAYQQL